MIVGVCNHKRIRIALDSYVGNFANFAITAQSPNNQENRKGQFNHLKWKRKIELTCLKIMQKG